MLFVVHEQKNGSRRQNWVNVGFQVVRTVCRNSVSEKNNINSTNLYLPRSPQKPEISDNAQQEGHKNNNNITG